MLLATLAPRVGILQYRAINCFLVFSWKASHFIFIPHHTIVAGYYGFMLAVHVSVHPSVIRPSIPIWFPDDKLSKHQWIFTKVGLSIDIVEIWMGIADGQISTNFDRSYLPETHPYFHFRMIMSKHQWIFTKLGMCIDIVEICLLWYC